MVDGQHRLNPTMKEVVKKELLKWLDVSVVYAIFDSEWVRPWFVTECASVHNHYQVISK